MRRINLALLALLQLGSARARSFSVHEDLQAFPQFDVVFSDHWLFDRDAKSLMSGAPPQSTHTSELSRATAHDGQGSQDDADEGGNREYKVMKLAGQEYLCTIPVVQPASPENQTATELAKAEEAKELSRATASGWELLGELDSRCLYFGSGWWTYKFCKNREIVQFHAAGVTAPGQPPRRDQSTAEFVLGSVPAIPMSSSHNQQRDSETKPLPAEVHVKGDQRYLVQRLEGGTICDLTGRERTIEVQYHCVPGMKEARISWIKEVTICAYLMVVNTPKLCDDPAFLPPKETTANPITCQLIVGNDATPPLLDQKKSKAEKAAAQEGDDAQVPLMAPVPDKVGDVVVGGRKILSTGDEEGKPPVKLNTPKDVFPDPAEDLVELVAEAASKTKGGKVEVLGLDELADLEIDPQVISEMREEIERLAGEHGWRIDIVDLGHEREIRGYVDGDEEGEPEGEPKDKDKPKDKSQEGSEERFKDEL